MTPQICRAAWRHTANRPSCSRPGDGAWSPGSAPHSVCPMPGPAASNRPRQIPSDRRAARTQDRAGSESKQQAQRELRQGQPRATSPHAGQPCGISQRPQHHPHTPHRRARRCPPTLRPQGVPAVRWNARQPAPAGPGQRRPGGRSPRKRVTRPENDQPARC